MRELAKAANEGHIGKDESLIATLPACDSVQHVCAHVRFRKGQLRDIPWMFVWWVYQKLEASNQDLLAACLADDLNYIWAEWLGRREATEFKDGEV